MHFAVPGRVQNLKGITATFSSITVTWDELSCVERNGMITGYKIKYGNRTVDVAQNVSVYTADGLEPNTTYTIQVAGMNSNGTGPYASTTYTTLPAGEGNTFQIFIRNIHSPLQRWLSYTRTPYSQITVL